MATKLDELQSPLLSKTGLDKLLVLLKNYLDNFEPSSEAIEHINERIDTLENLDVMTAAEVDAAWNAVFNPSQP